MNRNDKNNNAKKKRTQTQKSIKEEKNNKLPLYKIFMDENNAKKNKKFHLMKNPTSSMDKEISNHYKKQKDEVIVYSLNLELFSYKILEAKYNSSPDLIQKNNLDILIAKKKCHYLASFNEMGITTSFLCEYLRREYTTKESHVRIPQYANYYKNYLIFFCKPFFTQYKINKKMVRHMEKVAQIFYNENYAEKEKDESSNRIEKKKGPKIFNKEIMNDIENGDSYTIVNSETANEQILLINKKLGNKNIIMNINNNNDNNKKDYNNFMNNNKVFPIEIEQKTIIEDNYKITPIYEKEEFEQKLKYNKKKIVFNMTKSDKNKNIKIEESNNSINLLLNELEKEKEKEKKNNLVLNDNPYTFRKINSIISPNNKLIKNNNNNNINSKNIKKINNNCILIHNGKTTNNINININNLTIGQKIISPNGSFNKIIKNLRELNNINNINNDNILKKTITKFKYKESNNNSLLNIKDKNLKKNLKSTKNQTESALQNNNNIQNIQLNHKIKTNNNGLLTLPPQAKNLLPNFQLNSSKKQISSTLTNQVSKTRNQTVFKLNYNTSSMTNLFKYKKIDNNKKTLGRFTVHGSDKINFKNIISNNDLLSGERTRNTSNGIKRQKKIFTSILQMKGNNKFLNLKNKLDSYKNSENIISPINKGKKEFVFNRMKIKELKLKEKQLNLHKILNLAPSQKRAKSTNK